MLEYENYLKYSKSFVQEGFSIMILWNTN